MANTIAEASKELTNIKASLTRAINQITASCIDEEIKQRFLEDLSEIAFEIHHMAPIRKS